MLYPPSSLFSRTSILKRFVCLIAIFALMSPLAFVRAQATQSGDLRFELPHNANLRVENLRGAVMVTVWLEDYVSVSALGDNGQASPTAPVIDRGDALLSIRLPRGPKDAPRTNLQLRIPVRAHLAIQTADGSVEVQGVPAALLVQTFSGEISFDATADANAAVVADSKTGNVSSQFSGLSVNRGASPQLQGRLGSGGSSVKLYSQAGNISLGVASQSEAARA